MIITFTALPRKMILVDTDYLIALINRRDQHHVRAAAWASVVAEPLLATEYILWELANFYSAPFHRSKIQPFIEHLDSLPDKWTVLSASPALFTSGLKLYAQRLDKAWSLTDCISFVVMEQRGITRALAYDPTSNRLVLKPCSDVIPESCSTCGGSHAAHVFRNARGRD